MPLVMFSRWRMRTLAHAGYWWQPVADNLVDVEATRRLELEQQGRGERLGVAADAHQESIVDRHPSATCSSFQRATAIPGSRAPVLTNAEMAVMPSGLRRDAR